MAQDTSDQQNSTRRNLSAMCMTLCNAGLFANGLIGYKYGSNPDIRKAGISRMSTGLLYSGSGIIIARYSNQPVKKQLAKLEAKLAAYLKKEGVPLDAETLQKADHETQKGWFSKLEDFAYDHPMECAYTYSLLASTGILASGLFRRRGGEGESGMANIASYLLILGGTLVGVLVPQRTEEQIAKKGDAGTMWGKIQKNPTQYTIPPFLISDAMYGVQAHGEYKTASKLPGHDPLRSWAMAMPAISAFVMALSMAGNSLAGLSSKRVTSDSKERHDAQQQLIENAAHILASQPHEVQKELAQKAAAYLTHQKGLQMVDMDSDILAGKIIAALPHAKGTQPPTQPSL